MSSGLIKSYHFDSIYLHKECPLEPPQKSIFCPIFGPTSTLLGGPSPTGSSAKDTHPSLGSGFPIFTNLYKMVNFWPKKA